MVLESEIGEKIPPIVFWRHEGPSLGMMILRDLNIVVLVVVGRPAQLPEG